MADLPTGMVTFLFTDIEGSTPLWEREPEQMRLRSRAIMRSCAAPSPHTRDRRIRRLAMRSRPRSPFPRRRSRRHWRPSVR